MARFVPPSVSFVAYSMLPHLLVSRYCLIDTATLIDFVRNVKGISQCLIIIRLGWEKRAEQRSVLRARIDSSGRVLATLATPRREPVSH